VTNRKPIQFRIKVFACLLAPLFFAMGVNAQSQWKAGVARAKITPTTAMWMAGYAVRDHEAEGAMHDLWAKALVLEDAEGKRAVMVSTDLLGFPKALSDRIRDRLQKRHGLQRSEILLNSSHTHSGPVLSDALMDIYPIEDAQLKKITKYTAHLEEAIVRLVDQALNGLQPVQLYAGNGVARFQVNRRNNPAATLHLETDLNGPNDYAVPVLKVNGADGKVLAIAFGYACHNTVLSGYQWSGDYAGFAQLELEAMHPGAMALFFMGAGADQNPLPRGTVALARQYGRTLAAAVDRVLEEDMQVLQPSIATGYREVELQLSPIPTVEHYASLSESLSGYQRRWAQRMEQLLRKGHTLAATYPYPLQVWRLGDQSIFSLGGELVVGYAIALKRIFGPQVFVFGYSNDVMAYIPTTEILQEGGYEGEISQRVYGLPSSWSTDTESLILYEMVRLAQQVGVPKADK